MTELCQVFVWYNAGTAVYGLKYKCSHHTPVWVIYENDESRQKLQCNNIQNVPCKDIEIFCGSVPFIQQHEKGSLNLKEPYWSLYCKIYVRALIIVAMALEVTPFIAISNGIVCNGSWNSSLILQWLIE